MAKKRRAAAKRRKPARKRHASSQDQTMNALIILVVIVIALVALYFYVQNKKQALLPNFGPALATLIGPQHTTAMRIPLPAVAQTIQPGTGAEPPQPATAETK